MDGFKRTNMTAYTLFGDIEEIALELGDRVAENTLRQDSYDPETGVSGTEELLFAVEELM